LHQHQRDRPFLLVTSLMQPHDICFWAIQREWLVPAKLPLAELAGHLPPLPPNHRVRPVAPAWLDRVKFEAFSDTQWQYYLYSYYRQVEMMDADAGRVLNALEETGQVDDTVVIFTADHGDGRGRHLTLGKGFPYDEAEKVPLVFACPDRVAKGQIDRVHLVSGVDLMDTVCDLAGVSPPKTSGRSLRPLLENRLFAWRDSLRAEFNVQGRMLRTPQFKYVRFGDDPVEQLFDLQADPLETKNLYQDPQHAGVLADHRRMLAQWESRLEPVVPTPDVFEARDKSQRRRKGRKSG
jgi:arylsulfatase A-like enzyme